MSASAPSMARVVSFLDCSLAACIRMQLCVHSVLLPVASGEKMLISPPHGIPSSLQTQAHVAD